MPERIDAKHLKGLRYRTSEGRKVNEDGRDIVKHVSTERPLKPEDVLDWRDTGDDIVLVAADGQKHTVVKVKETAIKDK